MSGNTIPTPLFGHFVWYIAQLRIILFSDFLKLLTEFPAFSLILQDTKCLFILKMDQQEPLVFDFIARKKRRVRMFAELHKIRRNLDRIILAHHLKEDVKAMLLRKTNKGVLPREMIAKILSFESDAVGQDYITGVVENAWYHFCK